MTSVLFRLAVILVFVLPATTVCGQVPAESSSQTVVRISPAGVRRYEPGAWSTLTVNGINNTEVDSDELISVYVGENLHLQFGRRFWVPAKSRRQTFVPILVPDISRASVGSGSPQTTAFMMRIDESGDSESFEDNPMGVHIVNQPLLLDFLQTKTGILYHRELPDESGTPPEVDWDAYEAAYKARESAVGSRVLIEFGADFIPPFPAALDALDQMVISGDRILNDSAGLANLRHWLHQGGRIWIMLDETSMETVTALLGNEASCSVVDRVELNEFELVDVSNASSPSAAPSSLTWSAETPVSMLRVFAGTDDVHCRIGEWPVAFWQKVGDGEVLFTTLGARGWVQSGEPNAALASVARRFFQPREETKLNKVAVGALLNDQIGYRIPSRHLATTILGLNSLAILLCGCWWARQRKLERLAWFVPVTAVIATSAFLLIGSRNTTSVPSTVAVSQIVRVSEALNESHVSALSAIYSQESTELQVAADFGALTTIEAQDSRGTIKRVIWDDDGRSRWVNVQQPSGVVYTVETQRTVEHPTERVVHGTFDQAGFHGTLLGLEPESCEDAVIVGVPAQAAKVAFSSTGEFSVGSKDVLAHGQFIADDFVSDKQRGRQELMRELLASRTTTPFGQHPSLLVWGPPYEIGMKFDASYEQLGSALTSIPLRIQRPEAGSSVAIPAPFIRIESYSGLQGASSVFDKRTGKWMQNATKPTRSQLRCLVPEALLPMQLKRATVTVKINAPSRSLKIESLVDGVSTILHERANPNGVLRFEIDRPEALQLDSGGGFLLAIVVTETDKQREQAQQPSSSGRAQFDNSTWQIDYVRVDVEATVVQIGGSSK